LTNLKEEGNIYKISEKLYEKYFKFIYFSRPFILVRCGQVNYIKIAQYVS